MENTGEINVKSHSELKDLIGKFINLAHTGDPATVEANVELRVTSQHLQSSDSVCT